MEPQHRNAQALRRGDIINLPGRRSGLAVVLEPARDSDDPRPLVLTENRWAGRISTTDYPGAAAPLALGLMVEHFGSNALWISALVSLSAFLALLLLRTEQATSTPLQMGEQNS